MGDVSTTYDGSQHCSALKHSQNRSVSMDCPYTGKGEEFSPTNLVEAALGVWLATGPSASGEATRPAYWPRVRLKVFRARQERSVVK